MGVDMSQYTSLPSIRIVQACGAGASQRARVASNQSKNRNIVGNKVHRMLKGSILIESTAD